MAAQDQFLKINPPSEIVFAGPFSEIVNSTLVLTNTDPEKKVCFKVKTTAPKRYCVRPNNGVLDPNTSADVLVMRQAYEPDESETKATKHKFMVQSMIVTDPDQLEHMDQIWKDSTKVVAAKLKCIFKNPESDSTSQSNEPKISPVQTPDSTEINYAVHNVATGVNAKVETEIPSELSLLKKENLELKDEGARLRSLAMKNTTESFRPIVTEPKQVIVSPFKEPLVIGAMALCFVVGILLTQLMF